MELLVLNRHGSGYLIPFSDPNCNLWEYWHRHPFPEFNERLVSWSLNQIKGLSSALCCFHDYSKGERVASSSERLDMEMSFFIGLTASNVCWFGKAAANSDATSERGVLKISDARLTRIFKSWFEVEGRLSSENITYGSPDEHLHIPYSSASYMWTFGCLLLEFVTWLLEGSAQLTAFAEFRSELAYTGINDDIFYRVIELPDGAVEMIVRSGVIRWVEQLHEHPKCSGLIHDLLDLTMNNLLVIDPEKRMRSHALLQCLNTLSRKAENNLQYLVSPIAHCSTA